MLNFSNENELTSTFMLSGGKRSDGLEKVDVFYRSIAYLISSNMLSLLLTGLTVARWKDVFGVIGFVEFILVLIESPFLPVRIN